MRLKTLALTVAVLAVLAGVAYYLRRPAPPLSADARIGQTLVDRAVVEKAARLRLSDQGKTVLLARQPDGTWRVASYFDLPADFSKLTAFVGGLTDARLQRLVTTNPARIARLEFKDTAIALLDSSDQELWSVTLGKPPETRSGRFVRFGGESKAYLSDFSAWLDADSKNWANAELLNVKPDSVARIDIQFPEGGPVEVSRAKKDAPWTAPKASAGQKLKVESVTSLLGSIGNLRFSETVDPADAGVMAARANLRTVKLTTFDGKEITVALGRKPEEKKLKAPSASASAPAPAAPGTEPAKETVAKDEEKKPGAEPKADAKPAAPEFETIPAGPVFAFIRQSDSSAPINAMMEKRAFQVPEYAFSALPQKAGDLFEAPPPPPKPEEPSAPDAKKPADPKPGS